MTEGFSMKYFQIKNIKIGPEYPPQIVAEIGINHNGDINEAIRIAKSAINNGAKLIKHQTHVVEDEMSIEAKKIIPGNSDKNIYEIISSCALSEDDEKKLMQFCNDNGAIFFSTPFSKKAVDRLDKFNVPCIKIGSGECNNYPLVEYIAKKNRPIILSTGMNSIDTIKPSVEILRKYNLPFMLLHCVNVYPTKNEILNLNSINLLKQEFPDAVIGYSDHTKDNYAAYASVSLGACLVEKHYIDSKEKSGPDISCSMDEKELRDLIYGSKIIHQSLGWDKGPKMEEQKTINFAYASVVAIKEINKGDFFTENNTWVMRPGNGDFLAKDWKSILGKVAKNNIKKLCQISKKDIL